MTSDLPSDKRGNGYRMVRPIRAEYLIHEALARIRMRGGS